MKIDLGAEDLRPLVAVIVEEVLARHAGNEASLGNRLAFSEAESAEMLGIQRHVLRDLRLRGEIAGSKAGKRTVYERSELLRFLKRQRV